MAECRLSGAGRAGAARKRSSKTTRTTGFHASGSSWKCDKFNRQGSKTMKKLRGLWEILLVILAVSVLIRSYAQKHKDPDQDQEEEEEQEEQIRAPSRVSVINGQTVLTLDAATQKRLGLVISPLTTVKTRRQESVAATVLSAQGLVALRNAYVTAEAQVETARAQLEVSSQEYARLKTLYAENQNASKKALQAAEGTLHANRASFVAAGKRPEPAGNARPADAAARDSLGRPERNQPFHPQRKLGGCLLCLSLSASRSANSRRQPAVSSPRLSSAPARNESGGSLAGGSSAARPRHPPGCHCVVAGTGLGLRANSSNPFHSPPGAHRPAAWRRIFCDTRIHPGRPRGGARRAGTAFRRIPSVDSAGGLRESSC